MSIKDQIRTEIDARRQNMVYELYGLPEDGEKYIRVKGMHDAYVDMLTYIDHIPEQPSGKNCKTCGFYENNCPFIRDKFIPYPNKVCKDYVYSVMKAQSQLLEGLEEEILNYYGRIPDDKDKIEAARHFAEWQKKLDDLETADLLAIAHLQGMEQQKSKMMEQAVEGRIGQVGFHNSIYIKEPEWCDTLDKFNQGDRVRVLIVKEDKK